jgi:uncharacterized RDD family membrane protein YckC
MGLSIATTEAAAGPEPERAYARFLPRLRAIIIDSIILLVVMFAALMIASMAGSDNLARPLGFAVAAFWLLYEPLFVAFAGGTLGHRMANLRVVDDRTGGNVSFLKAVARSIIKGLLGWVSFITMLTTRRSQAVHDLLTQSTVQIRDISRAGAKTFVHERTEFASPSMPSWKRRGLIVLVYAATVTGLCFAIAMGLADMEVVSSECLENDVCNRKDELIFSGIALVWIVGCVVALVLGWRGLLYGARRTASAVR